MRSGLLQRAARRVVRGYPPPWRERYEGELLALLEDSPARLRDVFDLTRGLIVERARALFEPGDHPGVLATLAAVAAFARGLVIAAPPILAGLATREWLGPAPRAVERFAIFASLVFICVLVAVRVLRAHLPGVFEPGEPRARLSQWAGLVYLGLAIPIAFLLSWSSNHVLQALNPLWMFAPVWDRLAVRRPWQVEIARAIHNLRSAQQEMKWAQMELQRCEDLVAEGVPAPLQEARDAIERLARQRDEAMATLHGLGYRARLSNPEL
jgi:hypothetical protein